MAQIAANPKDSNLVVTVALPSGKQRHANLWKMDVSHNAIPTDIPSENASLAHLCSLSKHDSVGVSRVAWSVVDPSTLAVVCGNSLQRWTIRDAEDLTLSSTCKVDIDALKSPIQSIAWNPHDEQVISYASGCAIETIDFRVNGKPMKIANAHLSTVYDIDYNPNKAHCLASGGEDGTIKFWDLRQCKQSLLSLPAHSHWVVCVQYNRCHDQLLLTSSTDASYALWRIPSVSSAPLIDLDEQDIMNESASGAYIADTKVTQYEDHCQSVYSVNWAANGSWRFASLSFDGSVNMHTVPSSEKYKILL